MVNKIYTAAAIGINADIVEVEVDVISGLPMVVVVGLPDTAVKEARERVKSAIKNSSAVFPSCRVAINLAPADLPKNGSHYDLPIAVSILVNSGQLACPSDKILFLGELALDGGLRPVPGVLPIALSAARKNFDKIILPAQNAPEASLVKALSVIPVSSLSEVAAYLQGLKQIDPYPPRDFASETGDTSSAVDMMDIKGQDHAKRALEIAAAGGHNLLMIGPPGSGKTLLARSFSAILPKLVEEEILEVTRIYSVAGALTNNSSIVVQRPFRSPHHSASSVSLVGGGANPRPGEISLAHRGVLFLDELPEFNKTVLESLRQPLEDGIVTVARAAGAFTFPARFTLVAAQNPCPCGYFGDPVKRCVCSAGQVLRYSKKISGPLLDRIDLHVEVPRITYEKISSPASSESSESIRARVEAARGRQRARFEKFDLKLQSNSEMNSKHIQRFCAIGQDAAELLKSALSSMHLSARAYYRVLKVARTIADLAGKEDIDHSCVAEALQYRPKET